METGNEQTTEPRRRACEMIRCTNGHRDGEIRVSENIGDGAFSATICKSCAETLGISEGGNIPEPAEVNRLFTAALRSKRPTRRSINAAKE